MWQWAQKTVAEGGTCVRLSRFVKWIEMENHPEHMDTFAAVPPPLTSKGKVKKEVEEPNTSDHSQM